METLADVQRRIENARDLQSIVRTMKAMAAVSIRQYERAVEALVDYNRTTEMGLSVALRQRVADFPAPRRDAGEGVGVIVFGSDQGMCGQFNEQIAAFTLEQLQAQGAPRSQRAILAVGVRAAARLEEAGQPVAALFPVPGSVAGITPQVQEILLRSEGWRAQRRIDRVLLCYHRLLSTAAYRPRLVQIWPINPDQFSYLERETWPSRVLPTHSMDWQPLFSALLRQHLFFTLYRAFAESLASENAARLVSMQVAERNIDERLDQLVAAYHQMRQGAITAELMDIISGSEVAMAGAG